jgi:hypothetical protein
MEEDLEYEEEQKNSPIKWILSIFLILILLLWLIPTYAIKLDPSPDYIVSLSEVVDSEIIVEDNYSSFVSLELVNGKDPVVKGVADKIVVNGCGNKGKICHAKSIFYFVRDNFEYVLDPTAFEYVKSAKQSLAVGGGDCDDASVLLASLLDSVGVRTRFVFVPRHVYVQAYLPEALNRYKTEGEWVNLDATCKNCEFGEITYSTAESNKRYLG